MKGNTAEINVGMTVALKPKKGKSHFYFESMIYIEKTQSFSNVVNK